MAPGWLPLAAALLAAARGEEAVGLEVAGALNTVLSDHVVLEGSVLDGPGDAVLLASANDEPGGGASGWDTVDSIKTLLGVSLLLSFGAGAARMFGGSCLTSEQQHRESAYPSHIHPLLQRKNAEKSKAELHPETSFVEDIKTTVTPRRMLVFNVCLVVCYILASFTEDHEFAVGRSMSDVLSKEDCRLQCVNAPNAKRGICDDVKYVVRYCKAKSGGDCVSEEGEMEEGVDYVRRPKCSFKVVPREQDVVIVLCSVVMGIFLIIEGVSAELVFVGMAAIFAGLGIITEREAFQGFSSGGVMGLALLFPVAAAVEETGVLDAVTGTLLGNPSVFLVALFRMMIPVGFLSAFLANTAIVTMMIPVIGSWARRLDVSPGKLMMPLSFASQLGGTCTLIGSSAVLVAKNSVPKSEYDMQFFDLTPPGVLIAAGTMIAMALFLPLLESPESPAGDAGGDVRSQGGDCYELDFLVVQGGNQVGVSADLIEVQLERLPGVKSAKVSGADAADFVQLGSVVRCQCSEQGVVTLRRVQGLEIGNSRDLWRMGRGYNRRYRHLYEVVVAREACMVGSIMEPDAFRQILGACPIAIRGKTPAPSQIGGRVSPGAVPEAGDVVLLEADESFVGSEDWMAEFAVTSRVPQSTPQRVGGVHDRLRCVTVCAGMLLLCGLQASNVVSVPVGAGIFVFFLVLSNAMTMNEVYATINAPVLVVIAGASSLSSALQNTGLASFIASKVTAAAMPVGVSGIQVAVYLLAAGLSMFMNNSATIAILGPMLSSISQATKGAVTVQGLLFLTTFGAGTCLMTPLGYQTNLMVMKEGGYSFGSFLKYGAPLQLVHMFLAVGVVSVLGY